MDRPKDKLLQSGFVMYLVVSSLIFATIANAEECDTNITKNASFLVYYGWPFTYNCLNIFDNVDCIPDDLDDYGEYTCDIYVAETNDVIFNSSFSGSHWDREELPKEKILYRFHNITLETPVIYTTKLQNASSYWIENFTLKPQYLEEESCEENLNKTKTELFESPAGSTYEARCEVATYDIPMELADTNMGANIFWLYNCNPTLPANTYQRDTSLDFTNISYQSNPGVYTCVVEYNNMRRYRVHREICVTVPTSAQTTITCDDEKVEIGSDVEVECNIDAGIGVENTLCIVGGIDRLNSSGEIDYSDSKLSCQTLADGVEKNASQKRASCVLTTEDRGEHCFYRQLTEEEMEKQRTTLKFVFKIKNVQGYDFGLYRVSMDRCGKQVPNMTFTISRDKTATLFKRGIILIGTVAIIFGMIFFAMILLIPCKIETQWVCFKIFARKERNVKKYSAYLAYHYREDMPQTDPSKLKQLVMSLISQLQKQKSGKVYNDCEEHCAKQYEVENIVHTLRECHRVVIILTPEYINDEWSVLEAAEAWKNVIEQGTKIIFITFSETQSAIEKLQEKPRNFLRMALKRHNVIKWNGQLPLTRRFRMQLETYMPKLPKDCSVEMQQSYHSKKELLHNQMAPWQSDA